jgi:DNA invertase Pin-like site-specific DNA recombinase
MPDAPVKPSAQQPAVGYICVDEADDHVITGFVKAIAACCLREGVRLTRTLTDRGYDGTQLARPGIVELRELLRAMPGLTVVVPTLDHFSSSTVIRSPLVRMVERLGGRLIVARPEGGAAA